MEIVKGIYFNSVCDRNTKKREVVHCKAKAVGMAGSNVYGFDDWT
jgi:hypothetical protein